MKEKSFPMWRQTDPTARSHDSEALAKMWKFDKKYFEKQKKHLNLIKRGVPFV